MACFKRPFMHNYLKDHTGENLFSILPHKHKGITCVQEVIKYTPYTHTNDMQYHTNRITMVGRGRYFSRNILNMRQAIIQRFQSDVNSTLYQRAITTKLHGNHKAM